MRHQQKAIAIVLICALNRHAPDMGGYTLTIILIQRLKGVLLKEIYKHTNQDPKDERIEAGEPCTSLLGDSAPTSTYSP